MSTALWITGNLLAVAIAIAIAKDHGVPAALFAWAVIAMLADIRKDTSPERKQ